MKALPSMMKRGLVVASASTLSFGASWFVLQSQMGETQVPEVLGLRRGEAESLLSRAGLLVVVEEAVPAPGQVPGSVLSADPPPGTLVKTSRLIRLRVAKSSAPGSLPDFRGMDLSAARALLGRLNLVAEEPIFLEWPGAVEDSILGQDPEAGVPAFEGERVRLLAASGPTRRRYRMPSFLFQPLPEVLDAAVGAGLKTRQEAEHRDAVPQGSIVSQNPHPGDRVNEGDEIRLGVSQARGAKPGGQSRVVELAFQVPSSLDGPTTVKADLEDADGSRLVLEAVYSPGQLVQKSIPVRGSARAFIRFADGLVVERSWPSK